MAQDNSRIGSGPLLHDKIVVVTGASSGIGTAIAMGAAREGADLALTYRANREGAQVTAKAIESLGRRALLVQADVAEHADIARLSEAVRDRYGRVDAWINNAGADILTGPGATKSRLEKLDALLSVDLRGTMLASWAAVELMKVQPRGGSLINMSWDGAIKGLRGENPELFAAAKGGVLSFSRSLARSVASTIRVNVLGPGWIETAFGAEAPASFKEKVRQRIPLGRWGTPEDIAGAALYLASDLASYVTGQLILINGGDVM
jgi:3-oxoacyl-[acyl-carrier protein] reductase